MEESIGVDKSKPWRAFAASEEDEIMIAGMAGRFPECDNVDELAHNLYNKVDMITDREERWNHDLYLDIPKRKGVLKQIHKFDNNFFGIHAKQTKVMDPQGRILVECAYEAVVDAGINPQTIRGSNIGVFVANSFSEAEKTFMYDVIGQEAFNLTGNSRAMLANRISYALGLTGPSFTLDTACSSGMFALDSAFNAIRSGECDGALVCGANLLLHPFTTLNLFRLGVLSPSGYCRPFDTQSDGYSRSETVAVLFLQKCRDAKRVYAKLMYSQTNCDGYKEEGITFPSTKVQQKLLSTFYNSIGVEPRSVSYVEAHATGTRVGDPEECITLDRIFCNNRKQPLLIGSVKSSIGHSEASAAISSIVKVLLAYRTGTISPNINITQCRQDIPPLAEGRLKICTECTPLPGPLVAVNTFGFGGANAHALLAQFSKAKANVVDYQIPYLVTWAGRTKESADGVLNKLSSMPLDVEFNALLHNIQHAENDANMHRCYGLFSGKAISENAECLAQDYGVFDGNKRQIVWVFAGMGCQWVGMGAALMDLPIFRETIDRCQQIMKPYDIDVIATITSDDKETFNNGINSFVGIASIQIALVNILRHLDVPFDYCIGHSVGELGCAYADGCFTEKQMLLSAYARGVVSREVKVVEGAMAAVGLSYNNIKDKLPASIEVACHNSPDSSTISGPKTDIDQFVLDLKSQNIFVRDVPCSGVAYHSRYISEMGPKLLKKMETIVKTPSRRSAKWLSTSVPVENWSAPNAQLSTAEYHTNNMMKPVLFEEASRQLPNNCLTIEVAPHGLLQAIIKKALPSGTHIPLTNRTNKNNLNFFLSSLGRLFINGVKLHIDRIYPTVAFPVSSQTPSISPLIKWDHSQDWFVQVVDSGKGDFNCQRRFTVKLDSEDDKYMSGHLIDGRVLLPATGYLQMVREAIVSMTTSKNINTTNVEFENVKFLRATTLSSTAIELTVFIQYGSGQFEIVESKSVVVTGIVRVVDNPILVSTPHSNSNALPKQFLDQQSFYKELRLRGYHYDGIFRSVTQLSEDCMKGKIKWVDNNWPAFMDCLLQLCIISHDSRELLLPISIRKVRINTQQHYDILSKLDACEPVLNAQIYKEHDMIVGGGVEIVGLNISSVSRRKQAGVEVCESYTFVPCNNPTNFYSTEDALRICAQVVLENSLKTKVKLLEIYEADERLSPLIQMFDDVFLKMPLIDAELKIKTERNIIDLDTKFIAKPDGPRNTYNIVVRSNAFESNSIEDITINLTEDGFVFSKERLSDSWNEKDLPSGFQLVYALRTNEELFVLARRVTTDALQETQVVYISSDDSDFKWLKNTQVALRKKDAVILLSQGDPLSGVMGLLNCIRKEPNKQNIKCVAVMDKDAPTFSINHPLFEQQLKKNLVMNIFRNGMWGTYRHLDLQRIEDSRPQNSLCWAQVTRIGDLSSFVWRTGMATRETPNNTVSVHYSSINFKDVMIASGRLTMTTGSRLKPYMLGFEFSGIDARGERVMGMIDVGGFSTQIETFENMVWKVPKEFSLRDAATIPVAYITVYYAFFCGNKISKGKTILIHAGSGAVGLAAIRVAIAYGLEVFTTVSTPQKKKFIMELFPQLKESHIGNSRDTSFEVMIKERTNGLGVDFVLNSLSEEKLLASVRCLGLGGTFLEIGKFDIMNNSNMGMAVYQNEITFRSVFADNLVQRPDMRKRVYDRIDRDLKNGVIQPLKSTVFHVDEIEKAFRYLSTGKHMGKVMIQLRTEEMAKDTVSMRVLKTADFNAHQVYIVVGGLGGFGLEFTDWLILRGVRLVILCSRNGVTSSYQTYRIRLWESYGCKVFIDSNDITSSIGCRKVLTDASTHGEIAGIFNLAMVLDDSIFENQSPSKFKVCLAPKANATLFFDDLSRSICTSLQHFIVFSSASCGRGNAGQANYGMANAIMERIVERRVAEGYPGKAIQWGAVGEAGFFAELTENKLDVEIAGTLPQRIASCLDALDALITSDSPIVSTMVVAQKKATSAFTAIGNILNIMGLSDIKKVPKRSTLVELGMDSLMAVEIKQSLEREFDLILTTSDLRSLTFEKLLEISMLKSKKSFGETEPSAEEERSNGLGFIIKDIDTVEFTEDSLVKLGGTVCDAITDTAILIPGIEGLVIGSFRDLGRKVNIETYGLNVQKFAEAEEFDVLISQLFEVVLPLFQSKLKFILVSHSFGANIALELAKRLEAKGLTGRLLLIDGYPKLLKDMAIESFRNRQITPESTIDNVIENFLSLILPEKSADEIHSIIKDHNTIDSKLLTLQKFDKIKIFTEQWMRDFVLGLKNRLLMVLSATDETIQRIKSPIYLIRPVEGISGSAEERKQLEKYTTGDVCVTYLDGSHVTLLENDRLLQFFNETFLPK